MPRVSGVLVVLPVLPELLGRRSMVLGVAPEDESLIGRESSEARRCSSPRDGTAGI